MADDPRPADVRINRVRQLYHEAGVFEQADRLIDRYHERAAEVARCMRPEELQRLLFYLIDTVLTRSPEKPVTPLEPVALTHRPTP